MPEYDHGLVDDLKKKLFRRGTFKADVSRADFSTPRENTPTGWREDTGMKGGFLRSTFLKKFFIFSVVFFLLAVASAVYIFTSGSNIISPEQLELSLKGPSSVRGGEELNLAILVANHNSISLDSVDLVVTFPAGTREAGALEKDFSRYRKNLGTIGKSEVVNESVKAVLFGEGGQEKEIKVALEYRTAGSNAIFEKEKILKVLISASPVDVAMTLPDEVNAGNEVELVLDISGGAGTKDSLSDVLVSVEYPSGFRFGNSTPKPSFSTSIWNLGTLGASSERQIRISGILLGQDNEKKLFRATAGVAAEGKDGVIGVPYGSSEASVIIRRAFVDLAASLNGVGSESVVANAGGVMRGDINWTNNLQDKILNGQVTIRFSGNALDQSSVSPGGGFYKSTDDTLIWTRQHEEKLAIIDPGSSAHVSFDFSTLPISTLNKNLILNPEVNLEIIFEGTRVVSGSPGELVSTKINKIVRVNSKLDLGARAIYNGGPFVNSGSLPPRANLETTYTVMWSLVNTSNNIENAKVRAIIPSHARFLGSVSPSGTDLRYDPTKGELVWNAGSLQARASEAPAKEIAFQIALLPSVPQIGQSLPLLTNIVATGRDSFTGSELSDTVNLVDMRIITDPAFREEYSKVAP